MAARLAIPRALDWNQELGPEYRRAPSKSRIQDRHSILRTPRITLRLLAYKETKTGSWPGRAAARGPRGCSRR